MNRYMYSAKTAKPSAETTTAGIQKNNALRIVLPRLAAKSSPNNKTAKIQNRGDRKLSMNKAASAADPVALDPLRSGQKNANSAMNIAPLR
jgi:hypothetical protein